MKIRHFAANALTILIFLGLVFLGALGLADRDVSAPGPSAEVVELQIEKGASVKDISTVLLESGALPESTVMGLMPGDTMFRLAARYSGAAQELKYGEYAIPARASIRDIIALLREGGNVRHRVTIPEGMTVAMAVERIMEEDKLTGAIEVMPEEGSLFPDSWEFERGGSRQALIGRMQAKMRRVLDDAWANRARGLPLRTKYELLILASIIEKETRPNEHGRVASVFVNRLKLGMKLQTDPTVIYGITEGKEVLGRGLRRSELQAPTPYNTYVIDGLPPTPICNPGEASIRAAANPEVTSYLYFVADGTGGHAFAETLEEHNRNVRAWRQIEEERQTNQ